ncbi:DUF2190 family protein [Kaistia dalseonensis]|uniref:RecA/RadA family phage recombinase n=1 Tax=Kaistia dalseonensis TaxID=410840 RepID=A0ABU0HC16_9HYPH|nr:DUF2190 family protein [Kaistia dalseonensis]MCX5496440.1 DUF2190 family protein [Kaistia dalseonensis]MDQ0439061.1 putative RecA/RadA family phage recombinase [Kaistia dalseonensis]
MKNYIQSGDTVTAPAPAGGTVSGLLYVIGSLIGVATITAVEGVNVPFKTSGVYELPKTSALAIAVGDAVYWDAANKVVNKTSAGNTLVGYATEAAANPSAVGRFRLNV